MTQSPTGRKYLPTLRARAEAAVARKPVRHATPQDNGADDLLHELRVHQVELVMQNETLRAAQMDATASRDRYHELYDLAPVAHVTVDRNGTISEANLAATRLLRTSRAKLVGRPLAAFTGQDSADSLHRHLLTAFESLARVSCDLDLEVPDQQGVQVVPIHVESLAVAGANGRPPECRSVLVDLTEQRLARRDVLRAEQRSRELLTQLHESQKLEAVGTLASGVAHDFNNVLMGILCCSDIARESLPSDSPAHLYLEELQRAAASGVDITRQLLAFGRKREAVTSVFDLERVVHRVEGLLKRLIGEDILLEVKTEPGYTRVEADPGQVEQVVLNLAVNARDAMPGGGKLTITVRPATLQRSTGTPPSTDSYAVLAVSDTGVGMTQEVRARVFEPFFTTKGPNKGAGLGLSTVHGLVAEAGGHILISSIPGKGSTFEICWPTTDEPISPEAPEVQVEPSHVGDATVLLVEDDRTVRMGLRHYLQGAGYRVLEARDGLEAIACSEKFPGPIDLLLTDVVLPHIGGRQVALEVERHKPGVVPIFMSAHSADALEREGRLPRTARALQKPFAPALLLNTVHDALSDRAAVSHAERPAVAAQQGVLRPAGDGEADSSQESDQIRHMLDALYNRPSPGSGIVLLAVDAATGCGPIAGYLQARGWIVLEASAMRQVREHLRRWGAAITLLLFDDNLSGRTDDKLATAVREYHSALPVIYLSENPEVERDPPGLVLAPCLAPEELADMLLRAQRSRL